MKTTLLLCGMLLALAPLSAMGSKEAGGDRVLYSEGFESDTAGFTGRGPNEVLSIQGLPAHTGEHALTVSKRKSTWNGPMKDLSKVFRKGRTYKIEVWVRFDEGPEYSGVSMSFQKSVEGAGDVFENIGSTQMIKGQWTKFDVEYSVPRDVVVSTWKLYFETPYKADSAVKADDLLTFAIDDLKITQIPTVPKVARTDIPSFQASFPQGMLIGTAITSDHFSPENIHHDLLRHFNTFVFGNEMKQDFTEPREGVFRFGPADQLVKFAKARGVSLRGHTLVWHSQVPSWLFKDAADPSLPASKEVLLARLEKHIKTLVGRYKGQFHSWDVVNEAIAENGQLRDSPYMKIVGSDEFIEKAFRWAREADPDAKLVLNDYNIEYAGAKQDGFYRELKSLLDRGVPIDAVGLQSHISIGRPTVNDFKTTIARFAALGVDVQITELDVSVYEGGGEPRKPITRGLLSDQALKYAALMDLFKAEFAAGRLSTVLIWGMSDDETWLNDFPTPGRGDYPVLFDKNLQPKPAYWAVVDRTKMPVIIQRTDAYQLSQAPSAGDDQWALLSPRPLSDAQGKKIGSFKAGWSSAGVSVQARVDQAQVSGDDAVVFYLGEQKVTLTRAQGVSDAGGYTVTALLPLASPKTMSQLAFDLRVAGPVPGAWNDVHLTQDSTRENWGVLTLKPFPTLVGVAKGTPRIDAGLDPIWNSVTALPLGVESSGDAETGSTVKLLWDEGHLYALFDIRDKLLNDKAGNAYEQDSVELFLDQNNAKSTVYEGDDGQYRVSFRNTATFNGGQSEGFKSVSRLVSGGFRVMMAVPLYQVPGAAGVLYGFDAQQNNADGNAARVGIRNWIDGSNQGYQNTSGWGVIRLEAK